jgi:hypothetical protein
VLEPGGVAELRVGQVGETAEQKSREPYLVRLARRRRRDKPPRLSTLLRLLAESEQKRYTIAELIDVFQDRTFGALMLLFALLNLIPLPPGSSFVLGAPLVVLAAQVTLGLRKIWLPQSILKVRVRTSDLGRVTRRATPYLRRVERLLNPRLTVFFSGTGDRVIGLICLVLAILLFLPIPFANMLPALAIAFFSLALLERDGVAALVGLLVAGVALGVLIAIYGTLWVGVRALLH